MEQGGGHGVHPDPHAACENAEAGVSGHLPKSDSQGWGPGICIRVAWAGRCCETQLGGSALAVFSSEAAIPRSWSGTRKVKALKDGF